MEVKELEAAIEGILFAAGDPVGVERLCLALEQDRKTIDGVCRRLADRFSYERRGVRIVQLDASWQMCSAPEYAPLIRKVMESRRPARLSQPALEVLAIVAYFQPVTRAYVDQVRGVDSAYTVGLLLERELIEEAGRLSVPGRPIQYRTTKNFLRTFGLTRLEELPELPGTVGEDGQLTLAAEGLEQAAAQAGEIPDAVPEVAGPAEKPDAAPEAAGEEEKPDAAPEAAGPVEKPDTAAETAGPAEKPDAVPEVAGPAEKPDAVPEAAGAEEKPDAVPEAVGPAEKPDAVPEAAGAEVVAP